MTKVINQYGIEVDMAVAAHMMDADIREALACEGIETEQEFFDKYCEEHLKAFGEEWELANKNPVL